MRAHTRVLLTRRAMTATCVCLPRNPSVRCPRLCMLRAGWRAAVSPVTAGRRVSGWRAGGAPAMASSPAVIDLTSPATEAPPHRSGGRSRRRGSSGVSVIDLTLTSPRGAAPGPTPDLSLAHGATSGGDAHATTFEPGLELAPLNGAGAGAEAPPVAPVDGAARPPRFLFASGKAADLRKRGLLPVGEHGEPLCRWCKGEVQPPKVRHSARVGKNRGLLVGVALLTFIRVPRGPSARQAVFTSTWSGRIQHTLARCERAGKGAREDNTTALAACIAAVLTCSPAHLLRNCRKYLSGTRGGAPAAA